jgi:hypothetical protein
MATETDTVHLGQTGFRLDVDSRSGPVFKLLDWPADTIRSTITLAYPSAGCGGVVLSISRQARYAAAILYSGQSEIGYQLFSLTPSLKHLACFPFMSGESDLTAMQFSPDESLVAIAVEERSLWWTDPSDESADWDTPAVGGPVQWSVLLVHSFGDEMPSRYPLIVDLPAGWCGSEDGTWPAKLRFENDNRISLKPPWGKRFSFDVPLRQQSIVIPAPKR